MSKLTAPLTDGGDHSQYASGDWFSVSCTTKDTASRTVIVILSGLFTAANKWKKSKFDVPQTQKLDNTDTIQRQTFKIDLCT